MSAPFPDDRQDPHPTSTAAEKTAGKQRGRPFPPGQSGNEKGRPKGSRNKTTLAIEALIDGESEAIARKLIEKALEGDASALRLCIDRLVPARRERPVEFDLPPVKNADDLLNASASLLKECGRGVLSPVEAMQVQDLIARHARLMELSGIENRLCQLEEELVSKLFET